MLLRERQARDFYRRQVSIVSEATLAMRAPPELRSIRPVIRHLPCAISLGQASHVPT